MKKLVALIFISMVILLASCAVETEFNGDLPIVSSNSELINSQDLEKTPKFNTKEEKINYDRERVKKTFSEKKEEIESIIQGEGTYFSSYIGYGSYSLKESTMDKDFMKYYESFEIEMKILLESSDIVLISFSPYGIEFLLESVEKDDKVAACLEYSYNDDYLERVEENSAVIGMVEIEKLEPNYYFASVDIEPILPQLDESDISSEE